MSELIHRPPGDIEIKGPPGSRPLGVRVKPALRLAIGYRDEAKRGAPTKVDYFIPKLGAEGEFARAAAKFTETYGEKPKHIDIRLPDELPIALDIRYRAFAGGGDNGDGGVMVAKGETNFAPYDWVGGPDVLTVWRQDGTVEEVETLGVDAITGEPLDKVARELGLTLYTTFRFGIPTVLGYGSFCEITSKGKATTDSLWLKLRGWYSTFGPRTSWVVRPTLYVRPASARPVVKTKEGMKRIKTRIYVLDLVLSESEDELLGRLREHAQLTSAVSGSLWSGNFAPAEPEVGAVVEEEILDDESPSGFETVGEPVLPEPVSLEDELVLTATEKKRLPIAEEAKPPFGSYQAYSLSRILQFGDDGREWLAYALRQDWPATDKRFYQDLILFSKAHANDVYVKWQLDGGEGE